MPPMIVLALLLAGCAVCEPEGAPETRAPVIPEPVESVPEPSWMDERFCTEAVKGEWYRRHDGIWTCELRGWEIR